MAPEHLPSLFRFEPAFFPRIWGGSLLRDRLGWDTPENQRIGEAWLISDHPSCTSMVADGPMAGVTLRWLMDRYAESLLGSLAAPTHQGLFPLLLKLIDAGDVLSVQVHPDDATAEKLDESDVGKTEMWHVLESQDNASLICGLRPGVDEAAFLTALKNGSCADLMVRFPAPEDTSVFVPAGTVHAIGGGLLLAEIQQNSNITYRVYDWDRVDDQGLPRALHVDQALAAIRFAEQQTGPVAPISLPGEAISQRFLSACPYFAAEEIALDTTYLRTKGTKSFHILLSLSASLLVRSDSEEALLNRGDALLISGSTPEYQVTGAGRFLLYYVPDIEADIYVPLCAAGVDRAAIGCFLSGANPS